jgi:hypothetical protein
MRQWLWSICAAAVLVTGCYTAPVMPPIAFVYMNTEAPLDHDLVDTKLGSKTGRASTTSILGIIATGDASAAAAARAGNISTIRHADYEYFNVLGIYQRFTTVESRGSRSDRPWACSTRTSTRRSRSISTGRGWGRSTASRRIGTCTGRS